MLGNLPAAVQSLLVGSLPDLLGGPTPAVKLSVSGLGGHGWGCLNLRQALAPLPPVTFQVRDDNAIGPNRTIQYRFDLPPGTALLRMTLAWNDLPGVNVVNRLHLKVTQPAPNRDFYGCNWQAPPNDAFSQSFAPGAPPILQSIQNTEQVVIANPPGGVCASMGEIRLLRSRRHLRAFPDDLVQ